MIATMQNRPQEETTSGETLFHGVYGIRVCRCTRCGRIVRFPVCYLHRCTNRVTAINGAAIAHGWRFIDGQSICGFCYSRMYETRP